MKKNAAPPSRTVAPPAINQIKNGDVPEGGTDGSTGEAVGISAVCSADVSVRPVLIVSTTCAADEGLAERIVLSPVIISDTVVAAESVGDSEVPVIEGVASMGLVTVGDVDSAADGIVIEVVGLITGVVAGVVTVVVGVGLAAEDVADTWIKILREAFSNALRHAGATSINVSFTSGQNAGYQMTITNDGFCPDQLPREGNGLQSIRARLERFAGHLEIENGSQFTLRVSIP